MPTFTILTKLFAEPYYYPFVTVIYSPLIMGFSLVVYNTFYWHPIMIQLHAIKKAIKILLLVYKWSTVQC